MKQKLKEYIDNVFADTERRAPRNVRVAELKEELLNNLYEKYDDLLAAGKTPGAAYNIAISGVGDISGLLDSLSDEGAESEKDMKKTYKQPKRPLTSEEEAAAHKYRQRSAILTSVAVALYILCWVPAAIVPAIAGAGSFVGDMLGVTMMFLMIALATGLLIFNGMTKPKISPQAEWSDDDDDEDDDDDDDDDREGRNGRKEGRSPVYKAISGALWILTVCGYLLVSFATGAWHFTWMMFLITTAIDNIIKAIFDLRR